MQRMMLAAVHATEERLIAPWCMILYCNIVWHRMMMKMMLTVVMMRRN